MITFGHFYVGDTFVLYDLDVELVHGRRRYVATLSADPRVQFVGVDPIETAGRLRRYVTDLLSHGAPRVA